jgi:hypothetical protein
MRHIATLAMLMLFACTTPSKVEHFADKHPDKFIPIAVKVIKSNPRVGADFCVDNFPPVTFTEYRFDSARYDSAVQAIKASVLPIIINTRDTQFIRRVDSAIRIVARPYAVTRVERVEDSAKVVKFIGIANDYRDSMLIARAHAQHLKKRGDKWMAWALWAIGIIIVAIVLKVLKVLGRLPI